MIQNFSTCHPLRSTGVTRFHHYYEVIRLLHRHRAFVVSSSCPTDAATDRRTGSLEISRGKIEQCPAAPASTTPWPRSDTGRHVRRHTYPCQTACAEIHFRSVLRFANSFHSTRPHGTWAIRSPIHAVAFTRGCLRQAPQRTFTFNHSTMPDAPSVRAAPSLQQASRIPLNTLTEGGT